MEGYKLTQAGCFGAAGFLTGARAPQLRGERMKGRKDRASREWRRRPAPPETLLVKRQDIEQQREYLFVVAGDFSFHTWLSVFSIFCTVRLKERSSFKENKTKTGEVRITVRVCALAPRSRDPGLGPSAHCRPAPRTTLPARSAAANQRFGKCPRAR